jgi:hypothetical protein
MANDKEQGDVIYVALMHEELGWPDIYHLPPLFGFNDNTIWEQDDELDGKVTNARMDFKMDLDPSRVRNLETDSMYEYSPPPYTQRFSRRQTHPTYTIHLRTQPILWPLRAFTSLRALHLRSQHHVRSQHRGHHLRRR